MIRNKYSIILPVKEKKVLFNTIYGTLDLIDDSIVEKWEDKTYKWTQEESNYLSSRGHLTTLEDQELLEQKVLERESDKKDHKSKFYIVYSYICNFNCFYCFENNTKHQKIMSLNELGNVFEAIKTIIKINETVDNEIVLFGGEPLLKSNIELIKRTFEFAKDNNIKIGVITNGSNIHLYSDLFLKHKEIMSGFSITIDGTKKEHDQRRTYKNNKGSYEDILDGIAFLMENNFSVSIRMNLDKTITSSIKEVMAAFKQRLGVYPDVFLSLVDDTTCTGSCQNTYSYKEIVEQLKYNGYFNKEYGSSLDINMKPIKQIEALLSGKSVKPRFKFCRMSELYIFSTNGQVYICPQSCQKNDFCVGKYWPQININETAINNMHKYTALSIDECKNCALAPICGGGCYLKRVCHKTVKGEFICYKTDLEETLISLIGDMI